MLNKRLFFKKSFIILLCMIPLLALGMKMVAREDSGVLTVMLCAEEPTDELATQLIEELLSEDSIIRYIEGDEADVRKAVEDGAVDCAWVFRENFRSRVEEFTKSDSEREPCIYIVAKEDSIPLMLARTKLYGSAYPKLAYYFCKNFLQEDMEQEAGELEEILPALFEQTAVEDSLFEVVYVKQQNAVSQEPLHYLLSPMTGLLLVFMILCGFAAVMFYLRDEEKGVFAWIPLYRRIYFSYAYLLVAILDAAVVVWISQLLLQGEVPGVRETFLLLLYVGAAAVFCNLVKELLGSVEALGRGIPLILLAILLVSPIFIDVGAVVQYVSPVTYYLKGLRENGMPAGLVLYTLVVFGVNACIYHAKYKRDLIKARYKSRREKAKTN